MNSAFTAFLIKAWSLVLSIFIYFNGTIAPPVTTDPIESLDSSSVRLNVALWADPQLSNYKVERTPYFEAACQDIDNAKRAIDALLIAGDIAENGLLCEYKVVSDNIKSDKVKTYLTATGNHDIRMRIYKDNIKRFTELTNGLNEFSGSDLRVDSLHYKYEINGYTFIVLGSDRSEFEEAWFNDAQFEWLDESLAEAEKSGKPVFVVFHQPLKLTHGLPDTWGSPINSAGSVGKQSDRLFEVLNSHKKVVLITGHLHTGFGEYTYEKIGNIDSISLPSLTIDNENGACNDNGIGYMMEAYAGKVVFRARNFAKGVYMPEYDFTLKF